MLFAFWLQDRPGTAELRQQHRPEHREYLAAVQDRIAFAGPLLADDGSTMKGSLLVIDFDSRAQAQAWLAAEPFVQRGLFGSTQVEAFANLWPQRAGFPA